MRGAIALLLLASAATACTDTAISEVPVSIGDTLTYRTDVHTYLGYRCGSLDCHGDMGRTLRLYAERGLRANDGSRDLGISIDEVGSNLLSIAAFDTLDGPVEDNQILLKALAVDAGGMAHVGGDVWATTEAPGYQCVFAWLSGRSAEASAQAACLEATTAVLPDESN